MTLFEFQSEFPIGLAVDYTGSHGEKVDPSKADPDTPVEAIYIDKGGKCHVDLKTD